MSRLGPRCNKPKSSSKERVVHRLSREGQRRGHRLRLSRQVAPDRLAAFESALAGGGVWRCVPPGGRREATLPAAALKQLTIGEAMPKGAPTPTVATPAALEQLRAAIADDARNSDQQLRAEVQRRVAAEEEVARLRAALLEAQDEAERRREANAALRAENTRLRQVDEERRRLLHRLRSALVVGHRFYALAARARLACCPNCAARG